MTFGQRLRTQWLVELGSQPVLLVVGFSTQDIDQDAQNFDKLINFQRKSSRDNDQDAYNFYIAQIKNLTIFPKYSLAAKESDQESQCS